MNLQVDLMLASERRSGRPVRRTFLLRLTGVIIPLILLGLFGALIVTYYSSKRDRNIVEEEKKQVDPEYRKVWNLEKELTSVQDIKAAIQGWSDSRLDAYRLLRGLQRAAPPTIQLTQWILNEKVEAVGPAFGRTAGIYIK